MEQEQDNTLEVTAQEAYPLDDAAQELMAEMDEQMRSLNTAQQAVLSYFVRQHRLQGRWQLSPNRKELIKAPQ